jgi:hypothetical protein
MRMFVAINGVMHVGEVHDGSIQLDGGAFDDGTGTGGRLAPVATIDWVGGRYHRRDEPWQPIPEHFWRVDGTRGEVVNWRPITDEEQQQLEARP